MWGLLDGIISILATRGGAALVGLTRKVPVIQDIFGFFRGFIYSMQVGSIELAKGGKSVTEAYAGVPDERKIRKLQSAAEGVKKGIQSGKFNRVQLGQAMRNGTRIFWELNKARLKTGGISAAMGTRQALDMLHKSDKESLADALKDGIIDKGEFTSLSKVIGAGDQSLFLSETAVTSSWITTIAWTPVFNVLSVNTKKGASFDLPFFSRKKVQRIINGASPGKTVWGYWRTVGKGSVANKTKNLAKVKATKSVVNVISKAIPTIKVPKIGTSSVFMKNMVKRPTVKTSNIPGTGAKGIKISIKSPKIKKY